MARRRSVLRRVLRVVLLLIVLLVLLALGGLGWAHVAIRGERPPLPEPAALRALADTADRPVRITWIETASQRSPAEDGAEPQVITHPAFVIEWADGRLLLVDTGMDADAARSFGKPMEWLLGAEPMEVGRSTAQALGDARRRLAGVVFTHTHTDHTQGIGLLCPAGAPEFPVFTTVAQTERANYTTRPGLGEVRAAGCALPRTLPDEGLTPLPGLPGTAVIRLAGHTPDSQAVVTWVGEKGYVLAGDVVFEFAQIGEDRAKPLLYRLLITPEDETQLGSVRHWLRRLEAEHGLTVVPSHDRKRIESIGLAEFSDGK